MKMVMQMLMKMKIVTWYRWWRRRWGEWRGHRPKFLSGWCFVLRLTHCKEKRWQNKVSEHFKQWKKRTNRKNNQGITCTKRSWDEICRWSLMSSDQLKVIVKWKIRFFVRMIIHWVNWIHVGVMKHKTPSQYYLQFRPYNSDGSTLSFSGSHISSNWNVFENNPGVLSASDSRKEALIFYNCCQILLPPTFNIFQRFMISWPLTIVAGYYFLILLIIFRSS